MVVIGGEWFSSCTGEMRMTYKECGLALVESMIIGFAVGYPIVWALEIISNMP